MVSSDGRRTLRLDARPVASDAGWSISLQCRAEELTLSKRVVVYERVLLRKRRVGEAAHIQTTLQREELRVGTEGDVNVHGGSVLPRSPKSTADQDVSQRRGLR